MTSRVRANRCLVPLTIVLLLSLSGCGKSYYAVHGKVTYPDGKPVSKGIVVFESMESDAPISARGDIQPDGTYKLSTERPGDGVPAGKYRVLITPRVENPDAPERVPFDKRFTDFKTSGLQFEVRSGDNNFPIEVTRAGPDRR
jgi:hypothetical protein